MMPAQLAELRKRLAANRQPVERAPWSNHAHPRGWNDALDWVEAQLKDLLGERNVTAG
ncbi:hypothetical protein [Bradyrhizobium sp. SRS-191]|uniref:hypothetical protein n=1 Tax=Bradyrhizobium sp. SRS-191 TaxID=2962606 RepID=UPI00211EE700|nr:hypothetical protein [Bradyrhizobium sp. SRS-191]